MSYDMKWLYGAKREAQLLHCVNKTSSDVTNYTVAIAKHILNKFLRIGPLVTKPES